MTATNKILGQASPAITTETDLYTVPASTQAVASTLMICNRSGDATTFRISVAVAGAATENKQFLYYDITIGGYDTFAATVGMTLGAGDKVRVYAGAATLSFNLFGQEIA
jgi:hypothetical protein